MENPRHFPGPRSVVRTLGITMMTDVAERPNLSPPESSQRWVFVPSPEREAHEPDQEKSV